MDLGRPSTKSILMSTQGLTGMESGSNNPTGFDVSTLILWHISQHLIWDLTSDFIPFQNISCFPLNTPSDLQVVSHACAVKPEVLKEKEHSKRVE